MPATFLCPNCGEKPANQVRQRGDQYFCTTCGEVVDALGTRSLRIMLTTQAERDLMARALVGRPRPPGVTPARWDLLVSGQARALSRNELRAFVAAYGQGWLSLIGMGPDE